MFGFTGWPDPAAKRFDRLRKGWPNSTQLAQIVQSGAGAYEKRVSEAVEEVIIETVPAGPSRDHLLANLRPVLGAFLRVKWDVYNRYQIALHALVALDGEARAQRIFDTSIPFQNEVSDARRAFILGCSRRVIGNASTPAEMSLVSEILRYTE